MDGAFEFCKHGLSEAGGTELFEEVIEKISLCFGIGVLCEQMTHHHSFIAGAGNFCHKHVVLQNEET